MKLRTIIIDDEEKAGLILENMLVKRFPQIDIKGIARSVVEGVRLIDKDPCDLVFLDIELGDGTGFDVLKKVEKINFQVVFTTAYNEFAVDAFKVNAIDYLLKPVEMEDLERALQKVDKYFSKPSARLQKLGEFVNNEQSKDLLFIHELGHISFIKYSDIYYFKAEGQYTNLYIKEDKKKVSSQNLGYYEKTIRSNQFFRIHRSYMINLEFVTGLNTTDQLVELSNGLSLPFSNEVKDAFLKRLGKRV